MTGTLLDTPAQPRIVRDHYRELLRRNYIWMPGTVMFRREALERIGGFNPEVNASADYEVYLHIARHHPVHDHARVVAHYRKHDANMSGNAARMLRETLAVMSSQRPFLEGDEASLAAYQEGWRNWQDFYGDAPGHRDPRSPSAIGACSRPRKGAAFSASTIRVDSGITPRERPNSPWSARKSQTRIARD